jgi:hypothetical protein
MAATMITSANTATTVAMRRGKTRRGGSGEPAKVCLLRGRSARASLTDTPRIAHHRIFVGHAPNRIATVVY